MRLGRLALAIGVFLLACGLGVLSSGGSIFAISASDWKAGNIIDDSVFTDKKSMSIEQIQNWLDAKLKNCDYWGKQTSEYGGGTRAQYGASKGNPAPFTCLNRYYEIPKTAPSKSVPASNYGKSTIPSGARSAARLIYDAAQAYSISPKVLLVKLGTESSGPLTSDTWPFKKQYTYAMGAHCPDSGPGGSANCDINYSGFSLQMRESAKLLRGYLDNMTQSWWPYKKPYKTNYVLWNVSQSNCGGKNVYIENKATAALYTYTPYQPNSSALKNMYGTGDRCAAYGNRNFWRVFNDWFGTTRQKTIFSFKSHISGKGWSGSTSNSGISGTTGESRNLEAFKISGQLEYSTYNYSTGWQATVSNGMISGTTGMSRPIQAIRMKPISSLANNYDIYYRAHVSNIGWMGWAKNGQVSGVSGDNTKKIEAVEVVLITKSSPAPGSSSDAYRNNGTASYSPDLDAVVNAHVAGIGWQPSVNSTMVAGTTEQNRSIEALKISLNNSTGKSGNVVLSAHVAGKGWMPFVSGGGLVGTTGQSKNIEAIRIALTGELGKTYDIWYRGHVAGVGWMGWTKNAIPIGSVGVGRGLEAIETRILQKNSTELSTATSLYNPKKLSYPDTYTLVYSAHISNKGWVDGFRQNEIAGTTGQSRPLEALRVAKISTVLGTLGISCSSYSLGDSSWTSAVSLAEQECGTTGQSKALQALKLSLTGSEASRYSIEYKAHIANKGWLPWVKDGSIAGTPSLSTIEALKIKLVEK